MLERSWPQILRNMVLGTLMVVAVRTATDVTWALWTVPDSSHPVVSHLRALDTMWNYQLTLTTFVLTFFINQAYTFWRNCYSLARRIQGRINDLGFLLASHAARGEDGRYTGAASSLLHDVGRHVRLTHLLFWASMLRSSTSSLPLGELLSPEGMAALARRGVLTEREGALLAACPEPAGRHYVVLEWIAVRCAEASVDGSLHPAAINAHKAILQNCLELRATFATIPDSKEARMPLPYIHFVQLLVDSLVLIAPFALYPRLGAYSVLLSGLLTLFYQGLLELSKGFLDPFGNGRASGEIHVEVLLAETNAGSLRWLRGVAELPRPPLAAPLARGPPSAD